MQAISVVGTCSPTVCHPMIVIITVRTDFVVWRLPRYSCHLTNVKQLDGWMLNLAIYNVKFMDEVKFETQAKTRREVRIDNPPTHARTDRFSSIAVVESAAGWAPTNLAILLILLMVTVTYRFSTRWRHRNRYRTNMHDTTRRNWLIDWLVSNDTPTQIWQFVLTAGRETGSGGKWWPTRYNA